VEGGARAIRADASRAGHAHAAVVGPVNSMTGVAASLGQPAAANAFPAAAAVETAQRVSNVAPPVTAAVLPCGATTVVPDAAASVVGNITSTGSAGVAVDGSCVGP
jgi:hypothetical protein